MSSTYRSSMLVTGGFKDKQEAITVEEIDSAEKF